MACRTCYEDASDFQTDSDMLRYSGVSLTCPQQVVLVKFGQLPQMTASRPIGLRGCHEETAAVEFRLNKELTSAVGRTTQRRTRCQQLIVGVVVGMSAERTGKTRCGMRNRRRRTVVVASDASWRPAQLLMLTTTAASARRPSHLST